MKTYSNFAAALIVLAVASLSRAFTMSPAIQDYTPSGPDAIKSYTITNTQADTIAIKLYATTRVADENGKELRESAPEMSIFPKQFQLEVGKSRVIKVTYKGPANLDSEKAYRVIAEQLPVDTTKPVNTTAKTDMKFQYNYETAAYVKPAGAAPKVVVKDAKLLPGPPAKLSFSLVNEGKAHQVMPAWNLVVAWDSDSKKVKKYSLKDLGITDNINLLAGGKRTYSITAPKDLQPGFASVGIEIVSQ